MTSLRAIRLPRPNGFSLIEVAFALGLFSFALVALLGLFSLGLKSSKESEAEIEASHLASVLLTTRRASPIEPTLEIALPPLDVAGNREFLLQSDGRKTTDLAHALYRCRATITHPPAASVAIVPWRTACVQLQFSAPPAAPMTSATICYETFTFVNFQ